MVFEEDGTLTVTVPKKGTGISGLNIEEEEETEEKQSKIFFLKNTLFIYILIFFDTI